MKLQSIPVLLLALSSIPWCAVRAHPGHSEPHETPSQKPSVVAVVYSDFRCEPCAEVPKLIDRLITEAKIPVQVLFKHSPAQQPSLQAHEASLAAAQQGKFWEMHDLLFADPEANYSQLLGMARSLKLDLKKFQTGLDERHFRNRVISDLKEAKGMGITMTPTVFINGRKFEGVGQLASFVNSVLAPPARPVEPLDPEKDYEFALANSPASGPADAPVTIVEFSDFRCGFCTVNSHTLTEVAKLYPGKIRRVFKHFPISVDAAGMLPHRASMAAAEQGKFWEMHEALMKSPVTGEEDISSRAAALGLEMKAFHRFLATPGPNPTLQRDIDEGDQLGVRMTPTTFINGRYVSGRQSLESYITIIDALLGSDTKSPAHIAPALVMGPADASALVEFFIDFENLESREITEVMSEFRAERSDVQLHLKHLPRSGAPEILRLHKSVIAAASQGKFWPMVEAILKRDTLPDEERDLLAIANNLNLDVDAFALALRDHRHLQAIESDAEAGRSRSLVGPALFFNGERFDGSLTVPQLAAFMDENTCCGKTLPLARPTALSPVP